MTGKISVDINNGRIMELTQNEHDGFITLSCGNGEHKDYSAKIDPGELVMLMNYYRNCKDGSEESDYIKSENGEQEKVKNERRRELEKGDFIDYNNKRWHVDFVCSDCIRLTNINPLDGTKEICSNNWRADITDFTVVSKNEVDMSTLDIEI